MSSRNKMAKNLQCLSVSILKMHHQSQDLKVLQFWGGGGGTRPFFSVIIIPALAPKITSLSSLSPSPRPDPRPQTQTLGERSVRPGPTSSTTTLHREREPLLAEPLRRCVQLQLAVNPTVSCYSQLFIGILEVGGSRAGRGKFSKSGWGIKARGRDRWAARYHHQHPSSAASCADARVLSAVGKEWRSHLRMEAI